MNASGGLRGWAAVVALSVVCAVVGLRDFVSGKLSPFFGDIRYTHHPLIQAGARRDGRWPLWSDHIFNGYPIFADSQAAQYYPPTWLVRWWGDPDAFTAFIVLHVVIAAIGMVAWLRGHGFGLPAQLTGALCFAFSGPFLSLAEHLGLFSVLAWVPAWLAALHRVTRVPGFASVAIAGLVLGALILAGGPQMLAAAALLTACYCVGLFVQHRHDWRGRGLVERAGLVAATVVVGACVGGIALLPQLEFVPLSQRSLGLELGFASELHLAPHSLWRFLVSPTLPRPAGDEVDPLELYAGTLSVVLAIVGVITALGREHRRRDAGVAVALTAVAILTTLASLGPNTPVFGYLVELVPGFGYFRAPSRLIGIASLALAYGCGLGLEMWTRGHVSTRLLVGVASVVVLAPTLAVLTHDTYGGDAWGLLAALLVAVGLAALGFGRERAGWVIAAVTVIDLVCLAAPRSPFALLSRDDPPSERELDGRVLQSLDYIAEREGDPINGRVMIAEGFGYGSYNHTILRGLDGVSGYNGTSLLRFLDVMHLIETGSFYPRTGLYRDETALKPREFDARIDMLGAPYIVSHTALNTVRYKFLRRLYTDHKAERVSFNRHAVPRAYLSTKTIVAATLDERAAALRRFDPNRETVVEHGSLALDGPASIEPVALTRPRPEHLILECETEHPALLVITDSYYPGWRASVDGVETDIVPVNHMFRGVPLDPGAHVVELVFRPRSYAIGWRLTLGMLAFLALGAAWISRPRRAAID
ncbi:YfhO family protein [Enhygromyxa salina]|uniref:Bacterial membrane protein YfhO n=1 Tax=Enhygromyxa salina TaxID=215803 RepID=A0A2S9YMY7_9BACT|nr:YfhO family protein [Enhygromyxa salina]PRQ06429.1 Bacterial membrane protein YfhO [Enhygromyxa salina]